MVAPVDIPGADCGDIGSVSSRKGLVDRGRSGRLDAAGTEGERARLRNGLLDPKLAAVGEDWGSVDREDVSGQSLCSIFHKVAQGVTGLWRQL
jgi:hypothetical protein